MSKKSYDRNPDFQTTNLDRMVDLNKDLVEKVPQATDKITAQGNAVIENTDKLKEYNKQQYERVRLELDAQKAKAEANMDDYLRKEEETIKRINGLKKTMDGYDQKEIDQRKKLTGFMTIWLRLRQTMIRAKLTV
jgi:peptidoglycan hydrolase CwlO-like protein